MAHKTVKRTSDTFVESGSIDDDIASTLADCEISRGTCKDDDSKLPEGARQTTKDKSVRWNRAASSRSPLIDRYYEDLQASDTESDSDDNEDIVADDDDDDIGAIFAEIRDEYDCDNIPDYMKNVTRDVNIQYIETTIDNIPVTENNNTNQSKDNSCAHCTTKRRVQNGHSFKKGQHIRLPGHYFTFKLGNKLRKIYHHHAIVKQVNSVNDQKVEMILIHFTKVEKEINIHETTETFDLAHDEIFIVEYAHPRYESDEIVKRAESMLPKNLQNTNKRRYRKFRTYNLFTRNCEHFASWCVVGAEESFEVKSLRKTIAKLLTKSAGVGCKIARFIKKFLYNSADEIATKFSNFDTNCLPGIVLGFTALIYLIYCIVFTIKLYRKYKKGELCKVCFKREVVMLWTHFCAFIGTSGISYILVHFLIPLISPTPVGIPLLLVIVLLSLVMQWGIGKIRRALMTPYACDKYAVLKLSDLNIGNMITFKYFGFEHFAIVTEIHEDNEKSTIGKIRCVHYGLKSWNIFSKRQVIEDLIHFDLRDGSKKLKMVDCKHLQSYTCHQIVDRVRARVGEKNWNGVSNRSDHLCFWAVVKIDNEPETDNTNNDNKGDIGETKTKHKSSLCVGQTNIYIRKEVRLGDVVKYDGIKGIIVKLDDITQCEAQTFEMEVMVYRNYHARRICKTVDLKEKRMMVKNYHPAHCCSMEERVQRACGKEDKKCPHWLEETFIECCILKNDTAHSESKTDKEA